MNLIDLGQVTYTSRWFELSNSSSRGRTYRVEIKETVNCTCEFFNRKNTPCKHILYVYLNVLNVSESSHLLQQVYLTKNVAKYFPSKRSYLKRKYKTNKSCDSPINIYINTNGCSTSRKCSLEPILTSEAIYWLLKRTGNISKCHDVKAI